MARTEIKIDMDKLRACVSEVEAGGPLANRSKLYEEVNDRMQSLGEYVCTPQIVMLRINKYDIPIKTPKGKKGRQKGERLGIAIPPRSKRKMAGNVYAALTAATPQKYRRVVDKAAGGSLKALLVLKCLECGDYSTMEIKHCGCIDCPLYSIRPYKTNEEKAGLTTGKVVVG